MPDQVLKERADSLLALHQPGNPVVLPTVWDAWSAKLAVDAGFAALTIGSHPLADSIGKEDGEVMSFDDVVTRGATMLGAASRLCAREPSLKIFAFAAVRTISDGEVDEIFDPVIGSLELHQQQTFRRP